MDRLYAAGALEVFYVPVQMKKNRPGTLLTVVAPPERRAALADVIFRETTTIGLRHSEVERECLEREMVTVETPVGAVRFKVAWRDGRVINAVPEFDDCAKMAAEQESAGQGRAGARGQGLRRIPGSAAVTRFFLTTAIDYVNSRPHLGTAYEKIAADVIARYKRLCGARDAVPHGQRRALAERLQERGRAGARSAGVLRPDGAGVPTTWRHLDVSFDDFIRTTEPRHKAGVTEIARRIHDAGDIYEGVYEGWYCVGCEAFKQEKDLVDGRCPLHPTTTPSGFREKNYFFRLSKYQRPLLEHFAAHPDFLQPEIRRNEILRLLEGGLEDISVSRAGQAWGIPLPFDAGQRRVRLVRRADQLRVGGRPRRQTRRCSRSGGRPTCTSIGKDITRFHAVIWPAMLMSAKLPLPRQVFGHGFMTLGGQRMSKSLGTIVDPIEAADRLGVDPLRLYLVKEIPFGNDGDFSWDRFDERYNADLANNLGNLVSRVTSMAPATGTAACGPPAAASDALARTGDEAAADLPSGDGRASPCTRARAAAYRLSTRPTSTSPRPRRGSWRRTPRRPIA